MTEVCRGARRLQVAEQTPERYVFKGAGDNGGFRALLSALSGRTIEKLSMPADFRASVVRAQLGDIDLFHLTAGPHVSQLGRALERSRIPLFMVPPHSEIEGIDPGSSWGLDDLAADGKALRYKGPAEVVAVLMPRTSLFPELLRRRLSDDERTDVRAGGAPDGASHLLRTFVIDVLEKLPAFSENGRRILAETVLSLVNVLLVESRTHEPLRNADLMRGRVRSYILNHLWDTELTVEKIVGKMHCSKRYLHQIFHETGSTLMGTIQEMRLQRIAADLRDPNQYQEAIAAIAYRWGFGCPSQFSRAFRNRFDASPSSYRNKYRDPIASISRE